MMRISPARRAAIERTSLTLLVVISAAMIVVGKADQVAFQSLRNSVMDGAAPALDMLSRPATALDAAADRLRGFIAVYRDNVRLAEENERLLGWQQVALPRRTQSCANWRNWCPNQQFPLSRHG
jgi:rod shape-determining protein MreC